LHYEVFLVVAISLDICNWKKYNDAKFLENLIAEVHGMFFDMVVTGFIIFYFTILGEKQLETKRYKNGSC
jgi:hypothetical protein